MEQSLISSNSSEVDEDEKTVKEAEETEKNIFKQESLVEDFNKQDIKALCDEKIYITQATATINNNNNENDPTMEIPFQKMREGMEKDNSFEYLMKKKFLKEEEGKNRGSQGNLNDFKEMEFEKVCLFQKYFPNQNIDKIIGKLPKLLTKEKEIVKKFLRRKYKKLKYYSFLVNPIVERFLEESKAKKIKKSFSSINKRKNVHEGTDPFFSTLKSMQMDELSRASPLKKKSYFEPHLTQNIEKISFAELINHLVQKNRQS